MQALFFLWGDSMYKISNHHTVPIIPLLTVLLFALFLVSMMLGKYPLRLEQIGRVLVTGGQDAALQKESTVLLQVRIPRLAACILVGMALSVSGATYQGIFHNPMVSPDLLGASSGAAFGACCGILISASALSMHLAAFLFGLLATALTYVVSSIVSHRENSTITLVLTGMIVSSLFNAGVSITKLLADTDDKLGEITFWLMGSMTHLQMKSLPILLIPVLLGVIPLLCFSYRLNVLSFGDEEAQMLGVNVRRMRLGMIACATLATSASVAACGMVGWIGLVIPHLMRLLVGPDYHKLLPASALGGGIFLLLVDNITRIFFQIEVSIGILTALIGAPCFLILLVKGKGSWT